MIKNGIFVNIFSDYGWIYQTTFKTIRSDIKSRLFPKQVKIVPPLSQKSWYFGIRKGPIARVFWNLNQSIEHKIKNLQLESVDI